MMLCTLVDEFLVYISSVKNDSENTVESYSHDLVILQAYITPTIDITEITSETIRPCVGRLTKEKKYSETSINRFLSAVRSLFSYAYRLGYITFNPALPIKSVKVKKRLPNFMTLGEVSELCAQPIKKELLWKKRDFALFTAFYSTGCRLSELQGMKVSDLKDNFHSAVVHGKGGKDRMVFFEEVSRKALMEYLVDRHKVIGENGLEDNFYIKNGLVLKKMNAEKDAVQNVFVSQMGNPLSTAGIRYILNRYSGVEGTKRHENPHAFRHTFATQLLINGADVRVVQEMLGHKSISTTQRYTHITTDKMVQVVKDTNPHYYDEDYVKTEDETLEVHCVLPKTRRGLKKNNQEDDKNKK